MTQCLVEAFPSVPWLQGLLDARNSATGATPLHDLVMSAANPSSRVLGFVGNQRGGVQGTDHPAKLRALLEAGADPSLTDDNGCKPSEYCSALQEPLRRLLMMGVSHIMTGSRRYRLNMRLWLHDWSTRNWPG
jgi:hypothetical protein